MPLRRTGGVKHHDGAETTGEKKTTKGINGRYAPIIKKKSVGRRIERFQLRHRLFFLCGTLVSPDLASSEEKQGPNAQSIGVDHSDEQRGILPTGTEYVLGDCVGK